MHVLIYDDAAVFGGHERLAVSLARALVDAGDRVTFVLSRQAERLQRELAAACAGSDGIDVVAVEAVSRSFQGLRTLSSPRTLRRLAERMAALAPDVAVVVQGTIEISSLGLQAAVDAGATTVSYVPWGHSMRRTRAPLAPLRDRVNRRFYRLPHAFVTISRAAAGQLAHWGVPEERIHVVRNAIAMDAAPPTDRDHIRRQHGFEPGDFVVGCIGRIEFRQKAQDVLLRVLASAAIPDVPWKLAVVGDGPDLRRLTALAGDLGLGDRMVHVPWSEKMDDVYALLDSLVIPSHYEGVPLVMLEALYREIPVVAAARDGMAEVLPPTFLYPEDCPEMLPAVLARIHRTDTRAELAAIARDVRARNTEERFGREFRDVLLGLVGAGVRR